MVTLKDTVSYVTRSGEYVSLIHEFSKELLAAGCPETALKKADELSHAMSDQQWQRVVSKIVRTGKKLNRIEYLNEIWEVVVQLSSDAEIAFYGEPEMIALFALPKRKSRKKDDKSTPTTPVEKPKE